MQEFKHGSNTVRIHGAVERDKLQAAAEQFLKKVERKRHENKKRNSQKDAQRNLVCAE
jgi:hypothetical protein